jgi:hypothetical protein
MFWGLLDNFAVLIAYNEKDRLVVQIWLAFLVMTTALVVEEVRVPGESHRPWVSNW